MLITILIVLQVIDLATSIHLLTKPGYRETNPILAKIMERLGVIPALLISKGILIAVIYHFQAHLVDWVLMGLIGVYLWVCWNNIRHV